MRSVGVLHPGEMGAALARAAQASGAEVMWIGAARSPATRTRAEAIRLRDAGSMAEMTGRADLVVSICPPEAAIAVAGEVAAAGFSGLYLDANAVSPATARRVAAIVEAVGAAYVDGGVIGGPGRPHLYLSGQRADEVASAFGEPARTSVLAAGGPTAASGLKMLYAGWTKGSTALLLSIAAASRRLGVEDALGAEWESSQPGLLGRLGASAGPASKAWRWVGEMEEIAATLERAGLPGGFHRGAAEAYRRLAGFKDDRTVAGDAVLDALLAGADAEGDVDREVHQDEERWSAG
jgi:3-hydroxyisobutyrate dehydrogenase-like beta-hydroxyacid dehydrogenase